PLTPRRSRRNRRPTRATRPPKRSSRGPGANRPSPLREGKGGPGAPLKGWETGDDGFLERRDDESGAGGRGGPDHPAHQEACRDHRQHGIRQHRPFSEGRREDRAARVRELPDPAPRRAHGAQPQDRRQGQGPAQADPLLQTGQGAARAAQRRVLEGAATDTLGWIRSSRPGGTPTSPRNRPPTNVFSAPRRGTRTRWTLRMGWWWRRPGTTW